MQGEYAVKITDVRPILTQPSAYHKRVGRTWTFIQVDTDEGVNGVGEATNYGGGGSRIIASTVEHIRDLLIGENPFDSDRIWHKIYRRYSHLGSRGMITAVISGTDIALWDIKGKALGRPVYELLGGRFRESIPLYANIWFVGCKTPEEFAQAARNTIAQGYRALKFDPFTHADRHNEVTGFISAEEEEFGIEKVAAVRQAIGPHVDLLIDAHGHSNVPTAIRIGSRLAQYRAAWYEEPVPPENTEALRQVRESMSVPICVGERLFTRYDFVPIFENRLADYIMPDVVWTGGITELKKISTMAEAYYIPVSPHDASGPLNIIAGAHTMMTVPNFYRLEFSIGSLDSYSGVLTGPLDVREGQLYLLDRPGLGVELDMDFIKANPDPLWKG